MKHLISLSFKYIRRQKLHSVLTFLCILLAVFIFNTYTAYLGSTIATLINFEKYYNCSKHADLTRLVNHCEDKGKAAQVLANHAAVEDSYFHMQRDLSLYGERDENDNVRYLDIQFDNGSTHRILNITETNTIGSRSLMYSQESIDLGHYPHSNIVSEEDGVLFPTWVQELGYEVGDTITMTITPVKACLSEDSEAVKDARAWILENSNSDFIYTVYEDPEDTQMEFVESFTNRHPNTEILCQNLFQYVFKVHSLGEVDFSEETRYSPCTFTARIAGFHSFNEWFHSEDAENHLQLYCHPANSLPLESLYSGENAGFLEGMNTRPNSYHYAAVRISKNIDFDDGIMMLLKDLGLEEMHYYDIEFNDTLLAYEMRSANALAAIMPFIAAVLVLALVAWLLCRFVIDNAFEISVQERSAQFATLRIMGASRGQLVALVFTEAIFYCLTAVPIGVIAAFLSCKFVMETIGGNLFPIFTFAVNPWFTLIGIIISLSGILISAYTSAIWAARRLSLMEALQYGKPHKKPKKEKHRKSVLGRKYVGFILDYTMKNISRTKNRYVIATVSMALGIAMFSASMLGVTFVNTIIEKKSEVADMEDYYITLPSFNSEYAELAEELFGNSKYFSEFSFKADTIFQSSRYQEEFDGLQKLMPDGQKNHSWGEGHSVTFVSQSNYEKFMQPVTNMTYDEFKELKGALLYVSSGGSPEDYEWNKETGELIRKREDGYWTYQDMGLAEPPTVSERMNGTTMPVVGSVCFDYNTQFGGEGTLYIADVSILPQNVLGSMGASVSLTVNGHRNYEKAKAAIEEFQSQIKGGFIQDDYMENTGLTSFFYTVIRTLFIFLISVWLVGILTMVNSINTSVLNRQKELLMLRSVGMTKRQLQLSVMLEGILYCLVSTILGLLLGIAGYCIIVPEIGFRDGMSVMEVFTMPILLTSIGTLLLNLLIATLSAVPALNSMSRRMK